MPVRRPERTACYRRWHLHEKRHIEAQLLLPKDEPYSPSSYYASSYSSDASEEGDSVEVEKVEKSEDEHTPAYLRRLLPPKPAAAVPKVWPQKYQTSL